MKDKVPLEIKYSGPEVDDGTMSISDMVPALQGFANAYGKIAIEENLKVEHNIRVVGVNKGSFDILLEVCTNPDTFSAAQLGVSFSAGVATKFVIERIISVIKISKHVNNQQFNSTIEGSDNISITNSNGVSVSFPLSVYNIYTNGVIKADLAKIVEPLAEGKIDSATIKIDSEVEELAVSDKALFESKVIEVTQTQKMTISGWFNSLTKTTNRGFFNLKDGRRVSYVFAVENPEELYQYFLHKGPVEIECAAHLDENLLPTQLDIYSVTPLQPDLGMKSGEMIKE